MRLLSDLGLVSLVGLVSRFSKSYGEVRGTKQNFPLVGLVSRFSILPVRLLSDHSMTPCARF